MTMFNNFTILRGFLGKDPETKHFESGSQVTTFSMATNKKIKGRNGAEDHNDTQWHDVVCWGYNSKAAAYLKKGNKVIVIGEKTTRKWENKDGEIRYSHEVVATLIEQCVVREGSKYEHTASDDPSQGQGYAKKDKDGFIQPKNSPDTTGALGFPTDRDDLPF